MKKIKTELADFLSSITEYDSSLIFSLLERPKNKEWGLLSFPVFSLSKKAPETAQMILKKALKSKPPFIEKIEAVSGFVNFHFTSDFILEKTKEALFLSKDLISPSPVKKKMVVDYSSPNAAKHMNVGHLRATVIGQAIVHLARSFGHQVTALNHLGDWGTQFGKLILAYQKWGEGKAPDLNLLAKLYVRFHKEEDEELLDEARRVFKKMEEGDSEILRLWSLFVSVSMDEYKTIWKKLGVKHDLTQGESFYRDHTAQLEKQLQEKNLLQKSKGALVVFLDEKTPPCLIRKRDGASTYSCRDLASVKWRFENLKVDQNIYVTGVDHSLHFKQMKMVLRKLNKKWDENTLHLPFGMYRFPGEGKLSSRQGKTIPLLSLIEQASRRVLQIIQDKNPDLENKKEAAEKVAVAALIFNDLMNERTRDIDFSWQRVLDFEGNSGPFVQYSLVRCFSLFEKAGLKEGLGGKLSCPAQEIEAAEREWMEKLLEFEERCEKALAQFKPHILSVYLLELCRIFSRFYSTNRIIDSSKKEFRLALVEGTRKVLEKGLHLLGIPIVKAM